MRWMWVLRIHKATDIDTHTLTVQQQTEHKTQNLNKFFSISGSPRTTQSKVAAVPHLSLEMLQSMVVFRLVLTMRKGSPMAEFWEGSSRVETRSRFRLIRFLKARIWWGYLKQVIHAIHVVCPICICGSPCRNQRLFRRVFRSHRCLRSAVSLSFG